MGVKFMHLFSESKVNYGNQKGFLCHSLTVIFVNILYQGSKFAAKLKTFIKVPRFINELKMGFCFTA